MNITIVRESGKLPRIQIKDRQSYIQTNTKTYDDEAMRYLSYVLFPCVVGYFIYSLVYHEYKSWCAPCCLTGMDQLTTAMRLLAACQKCCSCCALFLLGKSCEQGLFLYAMYPDTCACSQQGLR
jgi:Cleft lip and palate transmembrane protein 1 (CLPTM1)